MGDIEKAISEAIARLVELGAFTVFNDAIYDDEIVDLKKQPDGSWSLDVRSSL